MATQEITSLDFEREVLQSELPVLVDFWADWCGPCRILSPIVDQVAEEYSDIKVGKVNVDENEDLVNKFGVMSIPTLIFFEHGHEVRRSVGAVSKSAVIEMIGH